MDTSRTIHVSGEEDPPLRGLGGLPRVADQFGSIANGIRLWRDPEHEGCIAMMRIELGLSLRAWPFPVKTRNENVDLRRRNLEGIVHHLGSFKQKGEAKIEAAQNTQRIVLTEE